MGFSLPICADCPTSGRCGDFNRRNHKKSGKDESFGLKESEIACLFLKAIYVKTGDEWLHYEGGVLAIGA